MVSNGSTANSSAIAPGKQPDIESALKPPLKRPHNPDNNITVHQNPQVNAFTAI